MKNLVRHHRARSLCLTAVICCLGCGEAEYERRFEERLGKLRNEAEFVSLYAPTEIPGTQFQIRIPRVFQACFVEGSRHPIDYQPKDPSQRTPDGGMVSPERLNPPMFDKPLRDLRLTFEGTALANAKRAYPFYCYIWSGSVPDNNPAAFRAMLKARLSAALPTTLESAGAGDWEQVSCKTPAGTGLNWHRIRASGEQQFFLMVGESREKQNLPGWLELDLYTTEQSRKYTYVLLGWRITTMSDKQIQLGKMAEATAGTLEPLDAQAKGK